MKPVFLCVLAVYLLTAVPVSAFEINEIELADGSLILAEVIALDENNYTLHSDVLGTFQVDRSRIKAIRQKGSEAPAPAQGKGAAATNDDQIKAIQEKIVSNKESVDAILSLQNDPDVQAVLEDQEMMKAAASGDISSLMANPKFMKLLTKPEIQAIGKNSQQ
jgi:hypothetical protein